MLTLLIAKLLTCLDLITSDDVTTENASPSTLYSNVFVAENTFLKTMLTGEFRVTVKGPCGFGRL